MTANTKTNIISASLGSEFVDGIRVSVSAFDFSAIDISNCVIFPGFCDVHVHFRETGFSF